MKGNKQIMEKADMTVADLIADGGYLQAQDMRQFVVDLIRESELLRRVETMTLTSHTQNIPKIGLNGRVAHPGTSAQALAAADRAKPETDQTVLYTNLIRGEIWLDDETLEDNVSGGTLRTTVQSMMTEQLTLDLEDLALNGDTTSTDPLLALQDGILATATAHTVNAGVNPISKAYLKAALKAMPQQYHRNKRRQEFWTSDLALIDYRDYLADRATALGDDSLQREARVYYQNRPIDDISIMPDNQGVGTNCTSMLLLDPANIRWGIWRNVRYATDRNERAGIWYLIASVRAGVVIKETDAVVKVYNIQVTA